MSLQCLDFPSKVGKQFHIAFVFRSGIHHLLTLFCSLVALEEGPNIKERSIDTDVRLRHIILPYFLSGIKNGSCYLRKVINGNFFDSFYSSLLLEQVAGDLDWRTFYLTVQKICHET